MCHCHHVTELMGTMAGMGARVTTLEAASGRAPLIGSADGTTPHGVPGGFAPPAVGAMHVEAPGVYMWSPDTPLQDASLGLFAGERFDRPVFDDTVAKDSEMQFDGLKGGVTWKDNVGTYFIGKCPALIEVLKCTFHLAAFFIV